MSEKELIIKAEQTLENWRHDIVALELAKTQALIAIAKCLHSLNENGIKMGLWVDQPPPR